MKALILAAGYGTRLHSLGKDTPKALLEVARKPLVNHILEKIAALPGLNEILLVTNDKFYAVFEEWKKRQTACLHPLRIVNDGTKTPEDRLGSIGDIYFVLKKKPLKDDLLVIGGDNLFDYALDEYIDFARSKTPSVTVGLYDVHQLDKAKNFGVVKLDDGRRLVSFEEKPANPQSTLIAMCLYYLPQNSLGLVDDYLVESNSSDTAGDYIRWLCRKNNVYGFRFTGCWYDIGSVESYREAQEQFK